MVTVSEPAVEVREPVAAAADRKPPSANLNGPKGIAAARGGKADKLQRISGIGPKNEKILHGLGIFHFDQIAAWSREQVAWVDDHLKFNGRITVKSGSSRPACWRTARKPSSPSSTARAA